VLNTGKVLVSMLIAVNDLVPRLQLDLVPKLQLDLVPRPEPGNEENGRTLSLCGPGKYRSHGEFPDPADKTADLPTFANAVSNSEAVDFQALFRVCVGLLTQEPNRALTEIFDLTAQRCTSGGVFPNCIQTEAAGKSRCTVAVPDSIGSK